MGQCPQGHASEETDYCSVCGAAMGGAAAAAAPAAATATAGARHCPACGEVRADLAARYCEVCRYDFVGHRPGPPPVATATPAVAPVAAAPRRWEVVITVDPTLDTEPDPASPCPTGDSERVFPIELDEMLIGRRDALRDIRPEIPISDPGASRRHAKLLRGRDGAVALQDLASANGTQVNGHDVTPGTRRSLVEGDEITIGRWTRIRLRGRP
jgi:hypothetical protein